MLPFLQYKNEQVIHTKNKNRFFSFFQKKHHFNSSINTLFDAPFNKPRSHKPLLPVGSISTSSLASTGTRN